MTLPSVENLPSFNSTRETIDSLSIVFLPWNTHVKIRLYLFFFYYYIPLNLCVVHMSSEFYPTGKCSWFIYHSGSILQSQKKKILLRLFLLFHYGLRFRRPRSETRSVFIIVNTRLVVYPSYVTFLLVM